MRANPNPPFLIGLVLAGAAALLGWPGCGSGEGTAVATLGISMMVGTAASGHALGRATVTIKDRAGHVATCTADATTGVYAADVTGFDAPFLVRATSDATVLFSIGTQAGTVNIHPFSDLIVRSYFQATGQDAATVFADPQAPAVLLPTPGEVRTISSLVRTVLGGWLQSVAGVDPAGFDLISGTLTATVLTTAATATGFDRVLEITTISGGTIRVDGSEIGVAQTTTATVSGSGGSVSCAAETETEDGTSTTTSGGQVGTTPGGGTDLDQALEGAEALFERFTDVAGRSPPPSGQAFIDAGLFDAGFLHDGRFAAAEAAALAQRFADADLELESIDRVIAFHDDASVANRTLDLVFTVRMSQGGNPRARFQLGASDGDPFPGLEGQADGTWRLSGNRRFALARVEQKATRSYGGSIPGGMSLTLDQSFSVRVLPGAIQAATVTTGPGAPGALAPASGLDPLGFETWRTARTAATLPPAGTRYTFQLDAAAGASGVYPGFPTPTYTLEVVTGATTGELADVTKYGLDGATPQDRASFSRTAANIAGRKLTVVFTRPTSYAVNLVSLHVVTNAGSGAGPQVGVTLARDATRGEIDVPASYSGSAYGPLQVHVEFEGLNGERTEVNESFP